jgi:hypothetical protein
VCTGNLDVAIGIGFGYLAPRLVAAAAQVALATIVLSAFFKGIHYDWISGL